MRKHATFGIFIVLLSLLSPIASGANETIVYNNVTIAQPIIGNFSSGASIKTIVELGPETTLFLVTLLALIFTLLSLSWTMRYEGLERLFMPTIAALYAAGTQFYLLLVLNVVLLIIMLLQETGAIPRGMGLSSRKER